MKREWKIRLDKITYGLIYPAFFGNMIYDVINIYLRKEKSLHFGFYDSLIIAILLVVYVVVDYMHLNADVNSVYEKPDFKSPAYFLCDILTPTFLFLSFVLLRTNDFFIYGILSFSVVPGIIWIYKRSNPKSKIFFGIYAIASLLLGTASVIFFNFLPPLFVEILIIIHISTYTFYMLWYYPNKSRKFDLECVEKLKKKSLDNDSL